METEAHKPAAEHVSLFCPGCNELFRVTGPALCPRCGAEVDGSTTGPFERTFLIRDALNSIQSPNGDHHLDECLAELVGGELHVYACETLLGRGAMGHVFLARHRDLRRPCALKVLSPRLAEGDPDYVRRFMDEGRAAAELVHPHIVTVHAIGRERGLHFLEMEFLPGRSLQHRIREEGRMPPIRATSLTSRIAEGLAAAHRQGILHRDLKPDNVLLTHSGQPKIADFGLAKRIAAENVPFELAGTPNFMAPELFQGEPPSTASDVYSLGVCYYLLLTGKLPYTGASFDSLRYTVQHAPLPSLREAVPGLPLEMAECVHLMLERCPANRLKSAAEAVQMLGAVIGHARDLESLLHDAFQHYPGVAWKRDGDRYLVHLLLPDGREQTVFLEPSVHATSERLLLIYSTCCEADVDYYETALRLNSEILHGGLAIREVEGRSMFVMIDTYPRATVDPEEIRRSVLEIAARADAVELVLTGKDCH